MCRVGTWAAAMLATLAFAAPAAATTMLVSNFNQPNIYQYEAGTNKLAQGFRTGSQGAALASVVVWFQTQPDSTVRVQLGKGSLPGSLTNLVTLTNPSTLTEYELSFTAPANTTLSANTDYMVVVSGGGSSAAVYNTDEYGEDPYGKAGWSVADVGYQHDGTEWTELEYEGTDEVLMIRVNGPSASPPAAPGTPTVSAVTNTGGSLSVSWTAPADNGSAITDYDLRYYKGNYYPGDAADWITEGASGLPSPGTATSATISGLLANTTYQVQVRAENFGGESAWSGVGSATTGSPPATNNAPRVLEAKTGDANNACRVKTGTATPAVTLLASENGVSAISPLTSRGTETTDFPASCTATPASDRVVPVFDDEDGDALTVTSSWTVPDNVFPVSGYPSVTQPATDGGTVSFRGVAALNQTNLRVDLTAVDAHGASARAHVVFQVAPPTNTGPPSFANTVGAQRFAVNEPIADLVLPAASGGDIIVRDGETLVSYTYAASGLPAGLDFDPDTRTVSGTPRTTGSSTVTYTAEDADGAHTAGGNSADRASLTFGIEIKEPPTVASVEIVSEPTFDTDGDGVTDTYGKNETVRFRVTFSEAMNVTGTPQLSFKLHPNFPAKQANYESGHGTAMLTFAFNIQQHNNAPDGIEVLANALALNGGTITTVAGGVVADLAHAGLPADPNHKVNAPNHDATAAPALQATALTGTALKLTYDKALDTSSVPDADDFTVKVAGTAVTLATTSPVAVSGTSVTLTLASTPVSVQSVTVSYTAGTNPIQDKSGNDAANLSDRWVNYGDTTPPALQTAVADGTALTLTYGETLDTDSVPDADDFTVKVAGSAVSLAANSPVAVSGSTVTLTLASAPANGQSVTVSYTADANPIQDRAGNDAANLSDHSAQETTPPTLQSTTMTGSALKLIYDETLDTGSVPDADDFTVKVAGSAVSLATTSPVAVSGTEVTLTLATAPGAGQSVAVSYTADTNPIQDTAGNDAADLSDHTVLRAAALVESVEIVSEPTFDADGDGATDTYGRNETVRFRVTFSEAMNVTGTPQLSFKLHPNFPAKQANYESGHGTAMLTFAFNIQQHNSAPDGIEVLANALALNGGTINAADGGVAAYLTHAGLPADPNHKVNAPNHDAAAVPELQTAKVTGTALKLTYDKALDTDSVPDGDDFTVKVAGSAVSLATTSPVAVSGSTVTLTLASAAVLGQTVTVSYTADTNPIQDKAGNDAANLSDQGVNNGDTTPPVLQTATLAGATLTLTYGEALDTGSVPAAGDFTVKVAGSAVSLASTSPVTVSGSTVTLNLKFAVAGGATVTVSYAAGTKPIRDRSGVGAADLSDHRVDNRSAATPPASPPANAKLFGNTGQGTNTFQEFDGTDHAQAFTTGGRPEGYRLTSAVISLRLGVQTSRPMPEFVVSVWSANQWGTPASKLGNLTNPASFRRGLNTFTASGKGINLDPGTTYVLVMDLAYDVDARTVSVDLTDSRRADSGSAEGWSAGYHGLKRASGGSWAILGYPRKISIHGYVRRNAPPSFPATAPATLSVAENSAAGTAVGTVAAADPNGETLTYALDETSDAVFDIDGSGAITVAADNTLDFESGTTSYAATVSIADGKDPDGNAETEPVADATHAVTINVTNVDEPPEAPEAPTVTSTTASSVSVAWTAPDMAGKPEITDHDVQYRQSGTTAWTDAAFDGTDTSTTISGLTLGATYEAQVRATNDEGTGEWSATGSGTPLGGSVSSVAFTNKPASGGYAAIGSHVEVTATFNQPVTVTGTPRIELSPAFGPNGETRHADYVSGSDSASLVFRYTLVEGDSSAGTNVSVAEDALDADGADGTAAIRAGGTEDVTAAHAAADSGLAVAVARPTIVRAFGHPVPGIDVDLDGSGDTYVEGDSFSVKVRFSDDMSVTGAGAGGANVQVVVAVGSTDYTLNHVATDGAELEFGTHTVVAADLDTDGITIRRDSVGKVVRVSGGASVTNASGNDAVLTAAADPAIGGDAGVDVVKVRGTNAAPSGAAFRLQASPGASTDFEKSNFAFTDADGDPMGSIQVLTLPAATAGVLALDGTAIGSTDLPKTVTHAQLDAGEFAFQPAAGFSGSASFTFKVVDSLGAASVASTATLTVGTHTAPAFAASEATLSIDENHADGASVGTVAATDADDDALTYWLTSAGTDHEAFTIDAEGEIKVKSGVTLDHEAQPTYALTAHVGDGEHANGNPETDVSADDTIEVTVAVGDVDEPPAAPEAPSVTAASTTSLSVSWTAPSDTGAVAAVTDYDLRYRTSGAGNWNDASHDGTGTGVTVTGLAPATAYEVQVRAEGEGESAWSSSGSATTLAGAADTQVPALSSVTVKWDVLVLTYGETLDVHSVPDADDFTVQVNGTDRGVSKVGVAGSTVTLTLASGAAKGATVTVSYAADAAPIRDAAGNEAADLSGQAVANQLSVLFARANMAVADVVQVYFTGNLGDVTSSGPSQSDFAVKANGSAVPLRADDSYWISTFNDLLELRLARKLSPDDVVTVSYTKGATPLKDATGNGVDSFPDQPVRNAIEPVIESVEISSSPSADADGDGTADTYVLHDRIIVDVTYNGAVEMISGTPKLNLDLGPDDATLDNSRKTLPLHSRINGNRTLRFEYTVLDADADSDGVWVQKYPNPVYDNVALSAYLRSVANHQITNDRMDGLPTSGAAGHKVDGSRSPSSLLPRVTAAALVSAPQGPNDTYGRGETVRAQLTFSRAVDVGTGGGTPRLKLAMAAGDERWANYAGGSGTTELTFDYPVASPDVSPGGVALLGATLQQNGGTIRSSATGVDSALWHAGLSHDPSHKVNHAVDVTGPAFTGAKVDGTTLTITFNEILNTLHVPAASAFAVTVSGATRGVSDVSIVSNRVTLTLASAVTSTDTGVKVRYAKPTSGALQDGTGNAVATFADKDVANSTDTTAPTLTSASSVNGRFVTLVFSETLDTSGHFRPGDVFTVNVDGAATSSFNLFGYSGREIILRLGAAYAAEAGDTVTLSYAKGSVANPIRDLAGNRTADFTNAAVTNLTGVPAVSGGVTLVSTPAAGQGGKYKSGDTVRARLTFDAAVDVVGSPVLKMFLGEGPGERDMTFDASGGRTNVTVLEFTYAIAAGDRSAGQWHSGRFAPSRVTFFGAASH